MCIRDSYRAVQRRLYRLFAVLLPPLWRLLLVVTMTSILRAGWPLPPAAWQAILIGWGAPGPGLLATLLAAIAVSGAPLVGLGILGRALSVALSLPIGFDIAGRGLRWDNGAALVAIVMLMLLGPGPFALWPVEEKVIFRRLGER